VTSTRQAVSAVWTRYNNTDSSNNTPASRSLSLTVCRRHLASYCETNVCVCVCVFSVSSYSCWLTESRNWLRWRRDWKQESPSMTSSQPRSDELQPSAAAAAAAANTHSHLSPLTSLSVCLCVCPVCVLSEFIVVRCCLSAQCFHHVTLHRHWSVVSGQLNSQLRSYVHHYYHRYHYHHDSVTGVCYLQRRTNKLVNVCWPSTVLLLSSLSLGLLVNNNTLTAAHLLLVFSILTSTP